MSSPGFSSSARLKSDTLPSLAILNKSKLGFIEPKRRKEGRKEGERMSEQETEAKDLIERDK